MAKIYYHAVPADWRKEQKYRFLDEHESVSKIEWIEITPDAKQNWLTAGREKEVDGFISIGNKEAKAGGIVAETIFLNYSRGVETTRDVWLYNFDRELLENKLNIFVTTYNSELTRWREQGLDPSLLDDFVIYDDSKIKWSSGLKINLLSGNKAKMTNEDFRESFYRPFIRQNLCFNDLLVHRRGQFPLIFPNGSAENENIVICIPGAGNRTDYWCIATNLIPNLTMTSVDADQCFPFYTYNEDGTNRRENITDWAWEHFRENYADTSITKWDIFYYTYAILHHPEYREKYAANLKRELPRIPFAPGFWSFAKAGKELADVHVNYEDQPEYKLDMIESGKLALDWRVERMKYNKDKTAIIYNDFLTLSGIPPEVHEYRLGNRSALDWIVDQYKVSIDKRSGITNDPNREDDPQYIVRLIKKIVTVSMRTNEIVSAMPMLTDE